MDHGLARLWTGATIWAGADCVPGTGWILVEGGRIAALGGVDAPLPAADEKVDATGCHILPGFVDVHTHLSVAASMPYGTDGTAWQRLDDALAAVTRATEAAPQAPWLLFWNAMPSAWPQARLPTADELETAAPGRRVLVSGADLHRGAISRTAFEELGVLRSYATDMTRDRRGRPTGELWEAAFGAVLRQALRELDENLGEVGVEEALLAEARRHLAHGITHAHDPYVPPAAQGRMIELGSRTPLRLSWATGPEGSMFAPPPGPRGAPEGPYGATGREVKIFLDGADRCGMSLPIRALPGLVGGTVRDGWRRRALGPIREGMKRTITLRGSRLELPYLRMADGELVTLLGAYAEEGFRIRLHALGNLAGEQAARALKAVAISHGQATVDHLTVLDRRTADLLAACGAYAGVQPGFLPRFGPQFATARIDRHLAVVGGRLLTAAGTPLVLSSDHPCGPLDPLRNLRTAVDRRLADGRVLQAGEALTRSEALRAATTTAAASLGMEATTGLTAGGVADMVVCTGDPFDEGTRVAQTWVAGNRAY